jgi:hypothetical protein
MAVLVWDSPEGRVVFALDRRLVVVGRDPESDLYLDDPTVSRRHALLERAAAGVRVTDLGSRTGTRINGATLTPELPSSLEFGDFVAFGRVVMSFHRVPPPAVAPGRTGPWKWIAAGTFGAAALAGGAFHLLARDPPPAAGEAPAPPGAFAPLQPAETPAQVAETEPKAPPIPPPELEPPPPLRPPERAKPGDLPPAVPAPLPDFPELLEIEGAFRPFRLLSIEGGRVAGLGADGRLYEVARERVAALVDRAEVARRVRAAPASEDAADRLARARWCLARHCRDEAEALVRGVLARDPGHAEAKALLAELAR